MGIISDTVRASLPIKAQILPIFSQQIVALSDYPKADDRQPCLSIVLIICGMQKHCVGTSERRMGTYCGCFSGVMIAASDTASAIPDDALSVSSTGIIELEFDQDELHDFAKLISDCSDGERAQMNFTDLVPIKQITH